MERNRKREHVVDETTNHRGEQNSEMADQLGEKKQRRNPNDVNINNNSNEENVKDRSNWIKTEKQWTELSKDGNSVNWREHQWPSYIEKTEGNLMRLLLNCHSDNGHKCQLDSLLGRERLEESGSARKISYIEYPRISVAQLSESYVEVLPSQKIPEEWVLGGSSRKGNETKEGETGT
ncbi:uncharacterized protein [Apostichopus japonicus]|uniref:uncharacterized protein n=1 Tax=Stichopus japonicus TaxID=307972 RepID=UPI003AB703CB